MKQNAVLLCRISDQKQDDGYSLDAQERFGVEYCEKKNFNILKIFRFVETGSKSGKRHKFDSMMEFLKRQVEKQKPDTPICLIVEKPDRLTRNFTNREQMQFFVMLGKLEIHYYKDRRVMDKNCSPADIFTDDMMTSVSKYIALNIAREVKKGATEKARNGWYPAHPPLGYKYVREGVVGKHGRKEARIVINQEYKDVVYRIFELRAVKKYSYESIGNIIREEFKQLGQKKYKFGKGTVERTLLHPFYGGTFEWAGKIYQGKHELFIPPTWVAIAQSKMRGTPNKRMELGPLSRFLKCGVPECGCQIIYDPKTKKNRITGEVKEYNYYHCTDGKQIHRKSGLRQINASESQIWEQLKGVVKEFSIKNSVAQYVTLQLSEQDRQSYEESKRQYFETKEKLEGLLKRQDRLYEDMTKGLIDESDMRRMREGIKNEIQSCRSKLENDFGKAQELVRERVKFTLELATDAEERWNTSSPIDRVVLLKNALSNLYLDGATVRYDLRKAYKILAQIKNKETLQSWCPEPDLNRHARLTRSPGF